MKKEESLEHRDKLHSIVREHKPIPSLGSTSKKRKNFMLDLTKRRKSICVIENTSDHFNDKTKQIISKRCRTRSTDVRKNYYLNSDSEDDLDHILSNLKTKRQRIIKKNSLLKVGYFSDKSSDITDLQNKEETCENLDEDKQEAVNKAFFWPFRKLFEKGYFRKEMVRSRRKQRETRRIQTPANSDHYFDYKSTDSSETNFPIMNTKKELERKKEIDAQTSEKSEILEEKCSFGIISLDTLESASNLTDDSTSTTNGNNPIRLTPASLKLVSSLDSTININPSSILNVEDTNCKCNTKPCTLKARLLASTIETGNNSKLCSKMNAPSGSSSIVTPNVTSNVNDAKTRLDRSKTLVNDQNIPRSLQNVSALESEAILCLANLKNTISKIPLYPIVDPVRNPNVLASNLIHNRQIENTDTPAMISKSDINDLNPPYNINIVESNMRNNVAHKSVPNVLFESYVQNKEELTTHLKKFLEQNKKLLNDLEQQRDQCIRELKRAEKIKDCVKIEWIKTSINSLNAMIEKIQSDCKYKSTEINNLTFEQYVNMLQWYKRRHALLHDQSIIPSSSSERETIAPMSNNIKQKEIQMMEKIQREFNLKQEQLKFFSNDSLVDGNRILKYPYGGLITNNTEAANRKQPLKHTLETTTLKQNNILLPNSMPMNYVTTAHQVPPAKLVPIPQYLMQNHTIVRSPKKAANQNEPDTERLITFRPYENSFPLQPQQCSNPGKCRIHQLPPSPHWHPHLMIHNQQMPERFIHVQPNAPLMQPFLNIDLKSAPLNSSNSKATKLEYGFNHLKTNSNQTRPVVARPRRGRRPGKTSNNTRVKNSTLSTSNKDMIADSCRVENENKNISEESAPLQFTINGNPLRPKPPLIPVTVVKRLANKIVCVSHSKLNNAASEEAISTKINELTLANEEIPSKRIKLDDEQELDENVKTDENNTKSCDKKETTNKDPTENQNNEEDLTMKKFINNTEKHLRFNFHLISKKTISLSHLLKTMNANLSNNSVSKFILKPKSVVELCDIIRRREIFLKLKEISPHQYPSVLIIMNHFLTYTIVYVQMPNKINYKEFYLKLILDKGPILYDFYTGPNPIALENIDAHLQNATLELHESIILHSTEHKNNANSKNICSKLRTFRKNESQNDTENNQPKNEYFIKAHGEKEISIIVLYEPKVKNNTPKTTKKDTSTTSTVSQVENPEISQNAQQQKKNNATFTRLNINQQSANATKNDIVPLKSNTFENFDGNSNKNVSLNFDISQLAKSFENWEKLLDNPENQRIVSEIFENHLHDQNNVEHSKTASKNQAIYEDISSEDSDKDVKNVSIKNKNQNILKREKSSSPDLDKTFDNIWNDMENSSELITMSEEELEKEIEDLLDKDVNVNNEIIRKRRISLSDPCLEPSFKNIRFQTEEILNSNKSKNVPIKIKSLTTEQNINIENMNGIESNQENSTFISKCNNLNFDKCEIERRHISDSNENINANSSTTDQISESSKSEIINNLKLPDFGKINHYKVIKIDDKSNLVPSLHETITNYWKNADSKKRESLKERECLMIKNQATNKQENEIEHTITSNTQHVGATKIECTKDESIMIQENNEKISTRENISEKQNKNQINIENIKTKLFNPTINTGNKEHVNKIIPAKIIERRRTIGNSTYENGKQYFDDPKIKININSGNNNIEESPLNLSKRDSNLYKLLNHSTEFRTNKKDIILINNKDTKTENNKKSHLNNEKDNIKPNYLNCKRSKLENVTRSLLEKQNFLGNVNNEKNSVRNYFRVDKTTKNNGRNFFFDQRNIIDNFVNRNFLETHKKNTQTQMESVNSTKICINFNTLIYINEIDYEIILEILYEAAKPLYLFYKFVNTTRCKNKQPLLNFTAFFFGVKFKKLEKYKKMYEELHKK